MTTMSDVVDFLDGTGPEFSYGLSNHGPMLAEALISLNQSEQIMPWLECYKNQLIAPPPPREAISEKTYTGALGDISRFSDWRAYFLSELQQAPSAQVLNKWVDRLAPGLIAAAMHGIIRTGHAVRSSGYDDSKSTIVELANGLAYWAARYQPLLETHEKGTHGATSIYEALQNLHVLPDAQRHSASLITEEVGDVEKSQSFRGSIDYFDIEANSASTVLSRLTEGFAFTFSRDAENSGNVIALVHAVTGPYALRHMLPSLDDAVAKKALRHAWHAAAALHVRYGLPVGTGKPSEELETWSESELIGRAVATRDEHAVKFTEACISEFKLNPNPIYLSAATICCRHFERVHASDKNRNC